MKTQRLMPPVRIREILILLIAMAIAFPDLAQEDEKKKKKGLNLGERMGKLTGDMLTAKTADLKLAVAKPIYYCGVFPLDVGTTESKLLPEGTIEGDHVVAVSFMKNAGRACIRSRVR